VCVDYNGRILSVLDTDSVVREGVCKEKRDLKNNSLLIKAPAAAEWWIMSSVILISA